MVGVVTEGDLQVIFPLVPLTMLAIKHSSGMLTQRLHAIHNEPSRQPADTRISHSSSVNGHYKVLEPTELVLRRRIL